MVSERKDIMEKAYMPDIKEAYEKMNIGEVIEPWEDGLRTTGKKGEYEWWYYDAKMDGGATLVLTFFSNNPTDSGGGFHPNVKIELTRADGTEVDDRAYFDEKDCTFAKDRCSVKMGQNFFEGDLHKYHIYVKTEKIEADITLEGNVAPWRPKAGIQQFGEVNYFAWLPSVPEGVTDALVTVDGRQERLHGTGYHDHNWGNCSMMDLMHHWYWGRAKMGPYTVISCYITATKKYGYHHFPVFMVADGEKLICDNTDYLTFEQLDPKYSEKTHKHFHDRLVYDYDGPEGHFRVTYKFKKMISSFSLLADEGREPSKLKMAAVHAMGLDPTYDRFDGEAVFEKIEGGETVESYKNPATWEMMYFRKDKDV